MMTRMKSSLRIGSTEGLPIANDSANAGVLKDLRATLCCSSQPLRLKTYRTRRGHRMPFLTNDFDLRPGVFSFLHTRRWDGGEQNCFGTWRNDLSHAKARRKGKMGIENQARLAVVTSVSIALAPQATFGGASFNDEKTLRKQDKREAASTGRPASTAPAFPYGSKVSRQMLGFCKHSFPEPTSPVPYERELRSRLVAYLLAGRNTIGRGSSTGCQFHRVPGRKPKPSRTQFAGLMVAQNPGRTTPLNRCCQAD
jgi:hypothetical protein